MNILATTESQPATLTTEDGNPFNVTPVPGGGGGGGGPLYSVVFQPGGTPGPNVFTTWASLYAAASVIPGGVRVAVDDSIAPAHMTAGGPYNLDGWVLVNHSGSATLIIDDGATGTWRNLFVDALNLQYNGTTASFFATATEANLYILDGSAVATAGEALVESTGAGLVFVTVYPSCVIGDGTNVVFLQDVGGNLEVFQAGGQYQTAAQSGGSLVVDPSVSIVLPYASVSFFFLEGQAALVQYTPAVPGDWPTVPTLVSGALDELAAELLPNVGGFSVPIVASANVISVPISNAIPAPVKHGTYLLTGTVAVTTDVAITVQAQVQRNGGASVGSTLWIHSDGTNRVSIPIGCVDTPAPGDFPVTYDLLCVAGTVGSGHTVQAPGGSGAEVQYVEL